MNKILGLTLAMLVLFLAPPSFANIEKMDIVPTLRQAADELEQTKPDLAEKLNKFADKNK